MHDPLISLQEGHWFKLICGASYQHLPAIRTLAIAYTLAGVDCIDVAADAAVITAVKEAIKVAESLKSLAMARGYATSSHPWLMVSFNDGEDPHFRKVAFESSRCPSDCLRPCEKICPANAIVPIAPKAVGVIEERCYGCGRCIPVCPLGLIYPKSFLLPVQVIADYLTSMEIDAIEIHTNPGHEADFKALWQGIAPLIKRVKLIAISCGDSPDLIDYLRNVYEIIQPLEVPLIWQTDGRPMSGDIGKGTTHAAIKLGQKVLTAGLPGYVQLAGGTNNYTAPKLAEVGLLKQVNPSKKHISGIAYGSYARSLLNPLLEELEKRSKKLEQCPDLLWEAVERCFALVSQLKEAKTQANCYDSSQNAQV